MKQCAFCSCKEQHFHAEGGLVVTLTGLKKLEAERDSLRTQLAEAHALLREVRPSCHPKHIAMIDAALSASAEPSDYLKSCKAVHDALVEPSAPVECDERAEFDAWTVRQGRVVGYLGWREDFAIWQARAALESKP